MQSQFISFRRAVKLLCDGNVHNIKVWKKNGEIMDLKDVVQVGGSRAKGNLLIKILASKQRRLIIDVNIFEIDGMEILL